MKRIDALGAIAERTDGLPVVVTCAASSRELAAVADRPGHLYLLDAMGLAGSVATGFASLRSYRGCCWGESPQAPGPG